MKYVVSVSKTYIHRGNHRHKKSTKKHWYIYYYEEGNFKTKRVNLLEAMYYKTQKRKRLQYVCEECGNEFVGLVKSSKEKVECPYCE